jgi:hypothetical protein
MRLKQRPELGFCHAEREIADVNLLHSDSFYGTGWIWLFSVRNRQAREGETCLPESRTIDVPAQYYTETVLLRGKSIGKDTRACRNREGIAPAVIATPTLRDDGSSGRAAPLGSGDPQAIGVRFQGKT